MFSLRPTENTQQKLMEGTGGKTTTEVAETLLSSEAHWGIDWLAISFPVGQLLHRESRAWQEVPPKERGAIRCWATDVQMGHGRVKMTVTYRRTGTTGYLWFNPSTCLYGPKSSYVARLDDAHDLLFDAINWAESLVSIRCLRSEINVSRVDVSATVLNVADVQRTLRIIKDNPGPRRKPQVHYGKDGRIETVTCRTKTSGGFIVYDKGLQAKLDVSALRFEIQAHRAPLTNVCPKVRDLTDENLQRLISRFLLPSIEALRKVPRSALDEILPDKKDSKTLIEMIGIGVLRSLGHFVTPSDSAMRTRYKPLLKRFSGRTVGDLLGLQEVR